MFYVYRFLNSCGDIIYVGKTSAGLKQRMDNHRHLPKCCYNEVNEIQYVCVNSESDMDVLEIVLINIYHPKYNLQSVRSDSPIMFSIDPDALNWEKYSYSFNDKRIYRTKNYDKKCLIKVHIDSIHAECFELCYKCDEYALLRKHKTKNSFGDGFCKELSEIFDEKFRLGYVFKNYICSFINIDFKTNDSGWCVFDIKRDWHDKILFGNVFLNYKNLEKCLDFVGRRCEVYLNIGAGVHQNNIPSDDFDVKNLSAILVSDVFLVRDDKIAIIKEEIK